MLRRRIVGLGLVAAVGAGVHVWRSRAASVPPPGATPRGLEGQARSFGEEARESLVEIGHELRDAKVSTSVRAALSLNRSLRTSSIEVGAEEGVVTLDGRVEGEEERARAEALAAAVPGVTRVVNQIQVSAAQAPAPGRTLGETLEDQTVESGSGSPSPSTASSAARTSRCRRTAARSRSGERSGARPSASARCRPPATRPRWRVSWTRSGCVPRRRDPERPGPSGRPPPSAR